MNIIILNRNHEIVRSLCCFVKHIFNSENVSNIDLEDPYRQREVFEKAKEGDLLLIDGFVGKKPMGFQFAKAMEKRILLLFYVGELDIEEEGPFWLVLPYALDRLGDKIKVLMKNSAPSEEEYEKLEDRFPELMEKKGHHQ